MLWRTSQSLSALSRLQFCSQHLCQRLKEPLFQPPCQPSLVPCTVSSWWVGCSVFICWWLQLQRQSTVSLPIWLAVSQPCYQDLLFSYQNVVAMDWNCGKWPNNTDEIFWSTWATNRDWIFFTWWPTAVFARVCVNNHTNQVVDDRDSHWANNLSLPHGW